MVRENVKVEAGETEIEIELTGTGTKVYQLRFANDEPLPEPFDKFEVKFD